jgi:hypothetical protein
MMEARSGAHMGLDIDVLRQQIEVLGDHGASLSQSPKPSRYPGTR